MADAYQLLFMCLKRVHFSVIFSLNGKEEEGKVGGGKGSYASKECVCERCIFFYCILERKGIDVCAQLTHMINKL